MGDNNNFVRFKRQPHGCVGAAAAKEIPGRYTWDYNAARVVELVRSLIASRGAVR